MPSVKGFYLIERYNEGQAGDGRYFVEMDFVLSHDAEFNDAGAPAFLRERFYDYKRAQDLIALGERVALMVTEWEGRKAITMAAAESDLRQFMRPASVSSSSTKV